jgi:translation initiation factor IF-3
VEGNIVKELSTNEKIRAREVLLITEGGEKLGVMPTPQALQVARERGMDLVEVAATARPPVCRLLDYGRYKFEQAKKERQAKRGHRGSMIRELRVRPKITEHDLEGKARLVKRLLNEGDKVKVSVFFRGREITHPDLGWKVLQQLAQAVKEVAMVDAMPTMQGNSLVIIFSPGKTGKDVKQELGKGAQAVKETQPVKEVQPVKEA